MPCNSSDYLLEKVPTSENYWVFLLLCDSDFHQFVRTVRWICSPKLLCDFEKLSAHILPGFYANPLWCWLPTDSSIYRRRESSWACWTALTENTKHYPQLWFISHITPVQFWVLGGTLVSEPRHGVLKTPHIAKPSVFEQKANPCHQHEICKIFCIGKHVTQKSKLLPGVAFMY